MFGRLIWYGVGLILLCVLALMGCASPTSSNAPNEFCLIAHPITWSPKDTDQTILQIKEQNAIGKKLCHW